VTNPDMPADIAAAIEALTQAVRSKGYRMAVGTYEDDEAAERKAKSARAALDTAILARLTAAETERDDCRADALRLHREKMDRLDRAIAAEAERDAALARAERLRETLEWIADHTPATQEFTLAHEMGDAARAALSPDTE
jgi:hypothetical protein